MSHLDDVQAAVASHPHADQFTVGQVPTVEVITVSCPAKLMSFALLHSALEDGSDWQGKLAEHLDLMAAAPMPDPNDPNVRFQTSQAPAHTSLPPFPTPKD